MSDVFGIGSAASGIAQAGASVAAATIQAGAIKDAAQKASDSAKYAQDLTQQRYEQGRTDLSPYRDLGLTAAGRIGDPSFLDAYTKGGENFGSDQNALASTPGYQFTLAQGLKATQNSAAARGLGVSGAAMKGAAEYATGLADKTYLDQFNAHQTALTNQWNRLSGLTTLGQSSAAGSAALGQAAAAQSGQIAMSNASAQGAAGIASGNALSSGFNGVGNAIQSNGIYNKLFGSSGGGESAAVPGVNSTAGYSAETDPYNY